MSAAEAAKAGIPLSTLDASSSVTLCLNAIVEGCFFICILEWFQINVAFTDADAVLSDSLVSVIGRQGVNGRDSIVQEKAVLRASEKVVLLCSQRALVEKLEDSVPVEIQQVLSWEDLKLFGGKVEISLPKLCDFRRIGWKSLKKWTIAFWQKLKLVFLNFPSFFFILILLEFKVCSLKVWRRPTSGEAGPMGGDFPLVTKEGNFVLDLIFTVPMENPGGC